MSIKSILICLSRRMTTYIKASPINFIDGTNDSGIFNYYSEEKNITISYVHIQWIIDAYIITFQQYLDKDEVNNTLELIRSRDESNQIIGLNALYNLQFNDNQINLKLYENGQ